MRTTNLSRCIRATLALMILMGVAPLNVTAAAIGADEANRILSNHGNEAFKAINRSPPAHGSAYGVVAAARGYQRAIGQMNFEEITVRGSNIRVELNGTIILFCHADRLASSES